MEGMMKTKIGTDGWPESKHEPLDFDDIARPIIKAIRFCYGLKRKNQEKDVPWKGPNIGRSERATCLDAAYTVSVENLAYSRDEQGRDALEEIVGLAIRLGIEQGRRIFRDSPEYKTLMMELAFAMQKEGKITIEQMCEVIKGDYDVIDKR
jgi:hypothetical protein